MAAHTGPAYTGQAFTGQESALEIAARIRSGAVTASEVIRAALERIATLNPQVNAFTAVQEERALAAAAAVDAALAMGTALPPLAGVPFAAKNLFDLEGLPTVAGSAIRRTAAPASRDGFLVRQMEAAGAICLGALNMDEFAYGFTTENTHWGACHNPHDLTRIAGGSSGGSGAAVAAGLVPITLGTDTNGSIRVPSSLNGIFGIKPSYGRLSRAGSVMFVASLDHVGPFARSVADLAAAYDALQGLDAEDAGQLPEPVELVTPLLADAAAAKGLRVGVLGGWFAGLQSAQARAAVAKVAAALGATGEVVWEDAQRARAAAFLITSSEGAALRLPELRGHFAEFEPLTQNRLLAGALLPAAFAVQAQRVRAAAAASMQALQQEWDILLAPSTPVPATPIGQETLELDGETLPLRASMGLFTQPISCIGLPVLAVPVPPDAAAGETLPIGVQLIGRPWEEAKLFQAAALLEQAGICAAPVAKGF